MADVLDLFSPATRAWFTQALGQPTPPQVQGWPAIQRGEDTLIFAPTGSGKTLTAFLWAIDRLYTEAKTDVPRETPQAKKRSSVVGRPSSIQLVYISPLKALNNDIERNLQVPIEGIRETAAGLGLRWPSLRVAVRTGDTPAAARAQMLKTPPQILITTPESLYLMLTSPKARSLFKEVRGVIVDEIHTLCGNKRGVHLALSLERLAQLSSQPVQRIGLSATMRPLDEAAKFLGGARPVTVVNAQYPKQLDLKVVTVVDDFGDLGANTIWPSVIPQVLSEIYRHHSTLIFANNRRLAERTADRLNAQLSAVRSENIDPESTEVLAPGGIAPDRGMFAIGAEGPIRAHHGSMSKEARHKMEEDLKAGRLPALVGTSSLELGIDIGAVDMVVQLQSPKSVSQGLQRVGRAGHLVGQTSRGRIFATFREDLVEAAAIAHGMLARDVEPTYTPQNPLDVLAQQIVAMVAMEDWSATAMFDLVKQAYPYHGLTLAAFHSVLEMLSGKYYVDAPNLRAASSLKPKIAWDRIHDKLSALPGSRMLAMSNVGTIPDTGAYGAYLSDGKTKVGELDEEFVFETRVGDTFLLGSKVWRVTDIRDDRILVDDAAGATPRMPFWNGDYPYRPYDLGKRIGQFRRELVERIDGHEGGTDQPLLNWLERDYVLDDRSAKNMLAYVRQQLNAVGVMSSDQTIVLERFQNEVGDPHLVIHSPFGGRVNGAWALAIGSAIQERSHIKPEMQTNDDGLIFRLNQSEQGRMLDLIKQLGPQEARERIMQELPGSAVFGAQFRMNAARALLMPKPQGQKRTPFWLQRLKAKDLLAIVSQLDDFPIVTETYRDCLRDVFDLPHLEEVLQGIQAGGIRVVEIETATPSPIASALLFNFTGQYLYEWDAPKAERQLQALSLPRKALAELLRDTPLDELLKPEAVREVSARAAHRDGAYKARSLEELALLLREMGDLSDDEVGAVCASATVDAATWQGWLRELGAQQRIVALPFASGRHWVHVDLRADYEALLATHQSMNVLRRYLRHSGPITRMALLARYGFEGEWLDGALQQLIDGQEIVQGHFNARTQIEYCDIHLFEQMHQRTLTILRKEVQPVSQTVFADFLCRWQHVHPETRLRADDEDAVNHVVAQLRGLPLPSLVWERDILPARIADSDGDANSLNRLSDEWAWVSTSTLTATGRDMKRSQTCFVKRGEGQLFLGPIDDVANAALIETLSEPARKVLDFLKSEGASYVAELRTGAGLRTDVTDAALLELVLAGCITFDSWAVMRRWLEEGEPVVRAIASTTTSATTSAAKPSAPTSALEAELAARLGDRADRPLSASRYRDAKRRVGQRLRLESSAKLVTGAALTRQRATDGGRWSLVRRVGVMGAPMSDEARAEALAMILLQRYGIVTHEALALEAIPWVWSQLYPMFDRLEMRGTIRRGYFVRGLAGVQFALPEALDELRRGGVTQANSDMPVVILNATDPALAYGHDEQAVLRYSRVPSTYVAQMNGQRIMLFEDHGERIYSAPDTVESQWRAGIAAFIKYIPLPRRLNVIEWNGNVIQGSHMETLLQSFGFARMPRGMALHR